MKWIGIVGSRRRDEGSDRVAISTAFHSIYEDGDMIVSGGCPAGADNHAEKIAKLHQVPIMIHYAQWNKHGRSAGFIRNGDIADRASVLIACVAADRTGGTEDTIKKFLFNLGWTEEEAIKEGALILV